MVAHHVFFHPVVRRKGQRQGEQTASCRRPPGWDKFLHQAFMGLTLIDFKWGSAHRNGGDLCARDLQAFCFLIHLISVSF